MSFDSRALRNAFGRFATGVCVVTASSAESGPIGMTINSFSSVSLEPPLVMWSLQNNSDCFGVFTGSTCFAINVLAGDQIEHSRRYSRRNEHALLADDYVIGDNGAPVLKGALAVFECDLWRSYEGGDHILLLGLVKALHDREEGEPLLYFSGGYRELREA